MLRDVSEAATECCKQASIRSDGRRHHEDDGGSDNRRRRTEPTARSRCVHQHHHKLQWSSHCTSSCATAEDKRQWAAVRTASCTSCTTSRQVAIVVITPTHKPVTLASGPTDNVQKHCLVVYSKAY